VVTVSIPSRARSAVVMPNTGLPPGAPCQAPSFLLSPPALKQATNALLLLGDRSAMGACLSRGAKEEGYHPTPRGSLHGIVFKRRHICLLEYGQKHSWQQYSWRIGAVSCKNAGSTEKEHHPHIINRYETGNAGQQPPRKHGKSAWYWLRFSDPIAASLQCSARLLEREATFPFPNNSCY
jgi:hypothetical protein